MAMAEAPAIPINRIKSKFTLHESTCFDFDRFLEPDKIQEYKCPICHDICEECVETDCGHLFGARCLDTWIKTQANQCPVCKASNIENFKHANYIKRKINALKVRCSQTECEWTGTLSRFEQEHVHICQFIPERCQYCIEWYPRKDMAEHVTQCDEAAVSCQMCGEGNIPRRAMDRHHEKRCPKGLVNCPLECGKRIPRDRKREHTSKYCPYRTVECPFAEFGCEITHLRACDLAKHLEETEAMMQAAMEPEEDETGHYDELCARVEKQKLEYTDSDDYLLLAWMVVFLTISVSMMWHAGFIQSLIPPQLRWMYMHLRGIELTRENMWG